MAINQNEEDFVDALKRLVDGAMGEVDNDAIIEALEGRIGVVRSRAEDAEPDDQDPDDGE